MKKMKQYPKTFEDVFTGEMSTNKCKIEKVGNDIGLETNEYRDLLRDTFLHFQKDIFDNIVKTNWLIRRFCYCGVNRNNTRRNGYHLDGAFGVFMRNIVGVESRMITRDQIFSKVATYFEDFFPDFNARDPFKEELKFPYQHVSLEYLVFVYQMDERLELLAEAEEKKMSYTEFLDYVINYVYSYNEDIGKSHYLVIMSHMSVPYIGKTKNYEDRIKANRIREGRVQLPQKQYFSTKSFIKSIASNKQS